MSTSISVIYFYLPDLFSPRTDSAGIHKPKLNNKQTRHLVRESYRKRQSEENEQKTLLMPLRHVHGEYLDTFHISTNSKWVTTGLSQHNRTHVGRFYFQQMQ